MIAKLLTIALPVNGDDARSFHRYSLRSSNFTFFISKTILFRFVVLVCMCMRVCDHSIACVCFYLLFFIIVVIAGVVCNWNAITCVSSMVEHQSRTMCVGTRSPNTWTLELHQSQFIYFLHFSTFAYCVTTESKFTFAFHFVFIRGFVSISFFLLLFSNWIVFVLFFPFFASSLSASISPLK